MLARSHRRAVVPLVLLACLALASIGAIRAQEPPATPTATVEESTQPNSAVDPETRAREMVAELRRALSKGEAAIRRDAPPGELTSGSGLLQALSERVATGHRTLLARVFRLEALSRLLRPHPSDTRVLWAIHTALQFDPVIADDLVSFGETGRHIQKLLLEEQERFSEVSPGRPLPEILARPPRRFPAPAEAAGIEGVVTVRCVVDREGERHRPEVVAPRDDATSLELAALEYLSQFRFEPATTRQERKRRPAFYAVRLRYELPDRDPPATDGEAKP